MLASLRVPESSAPGNRVGTHRLLPRTHLTCQQPHVSISFRPAVSAPTSSAVGKGTHILLPRIHATCRKTHSLVSNLAPLHLPENKRAGETGERTQIISKRRANSIATTNRNSKMRKHLLPASSPVDVRLPRPNVSDAQRHTKSAPRHDPRTASSATRAPGNRNLRICWGCRCGWKSQSVVHLQQPTGMFSVFHA